MPDEGVERVVGYFTCRKTGQIWLLFLSSQARLRRMDSARIGLDQLIEARRDCGFGARSADAWSCGGLRRTLAARHQSENPEEKKPSEATGHVFLRNFSHGSSSLARGVNHT